MGGLNANESSVNRVVNLAHIGEQTSISQTPRRTNLELVNGLCDSLTEESRWHIGSTGCVCARFAAGMCEIPVERAGNGLIGSLYNTLVVRQRYYILRDMIVHAAGHMICECPLRHKINTEQALQRG